jgi:hypothetical protein
MINNDYFFILVIPFFIFFEIAIYNISESLYWKWMCWKCKNK